MSTIIIRIDEVIMKKIFLILLATINIGFAAQPCANYKYLPTYLADDYLPIRASSGLPTDQMKVGTPYTIRCKIFVKNFSHNALLGLKWSGFNDQVITYTVNDEAANPTGHSWDARLTLTQEYNVVYFQHVIKQQESNESVNVMNGIEAVTNYLVYSCVLIEEKN